MKPRPSTAVSPYSRKVQAKPTVPGEGRVRVWARAQPPGCFQVEHQKVSSPKAESPDGRFAELIDNCQISKTLKEGLGLIVPEAGKELGSDPQALTRAACLYGKAHLPTSKTLTSVVRAKSETVSREEVTFTLAAKQLQDAALAEPSSEKKTKKILRYSMNWFFSDIRIQGTDFQSIWPVSD